MKVERIEDLYPAELYGGDRYYFTINNAGVRFIAFCIYNQTPTWEQIINDVIQWCNHKNIKLEHLAEHGCFRHGDYGIWRFIPDSGKEYISWYLITHI